MAWTRYLVYSNTPIVDIEHLVLDHLLISLKARVSVPPAPAAAAAAMRIEATASRLVLRSLPSLAFGKLGLAIPAASLRLMVHILRKLINAA
jgi:hypothetical protein